MERSVKRKLAIGVTGLVVLGGGGAAYAVTKSNNDNRQAFLGDVAKRLNVTPQKLNDAIKGAFEDRLDAAVKAGHLTQAQADRLKKKVEANGGPPVFGAGPPIGGRFFFRGGPGRPGGPIHDGLDAAARYLGLTDAQLLGKLKSGKTLAEVAGDQNKSVDGLKSAIKASVKADLDRAVQDKRLTQTEESNILGKLDKGIDNLVNGKRIGPPPRLGGPRGFGAKRGFHFGAAPPGGPPPGVPII